LIQYCIAYLIKNLSVDETAIKTQIEKSTVEKVYNLYQQSEHKRLPAQKPPID
jgi:NAD+ synthase